MRSLRESPSAAIIRAHLKKLRYVWAPEFILFVVMIRILLLLLLFVSPSFGKPPNIILVMSDDHGYGDCGYTGHPFVKTPHLDEMAKQSVVLDRAPHLVVHVNRL